MPRLLVSFSGRDIKGGSNQRGAGFFYGVGGRGASYNNPASLLNLTPVIVDRLFNAYQTDLPRKVDFVGGIERCKSRYVLVDDKPETTRHSTCNKP